MDDDMRRNRTVLHVAGRYLAGAAFRRRAGTRQTERAEGRSRGWRWSGQLGAGVYPDSPGWVCLAVEDAPSLLQFSCEWMEFTAEKGPAERGERKW